MKEAEENSDSKDKIILITQPKQMGEKKQTEHQDVGDHKIRFNIHVTRV